MFVLIRRMFICSFITLSMIMAASIATMGEPYSQESPDIMPLPASLLTPSYVPAPQKGSK